MSFKSRINIEMLLLLKKELKLTFLGLINVVSCPQTQAAHVISSGRCYIIHAVSAHLYVRPVH